MRLYEEVIPVKARYSGLLIIIASFIGGYALLKAMDEALCMPRSR